MVRMEALSSCSAFGSMTRTLHRFQILHAEVAVGIGPVASGHPAGCAGLTRERLRGVFVTVLGNQPLTGGKLHALPSKMNRLLPQPQQMHLDPAVRRPPDRLVPKARQVEVRGEL